MITASVGTVAADRLTEALPDPARKTLPGQGHHVDPGVLAQDLLPGFRRWQVAARR